MVTYWIEKEGNGFMVYGYHKGFNTIRSIHFYKTKKAAENYINKVNNK